MSPKWLSTLTRARKAQEDVAQQYLAGAERAVRRSQARVRYDQERLDGLCTVDAQLHASTFVATAVALQAAAATLAATVDAARAADDTAAVRRVSLQGAARARHTAEELTDRAVAIDNHRAAALAQRDLDEVAARMHRTKTQEHSK